MLRGQEELWGDEREPAKGRGDKCRPPTAWPFSTIRLVLSSPKVQKCSHFHFATFCHSMKLLSCMRACMCVGVCVLHWCIDSFITNTDILKCVCLIYWWKMQSVARMCWLQALWTQLIRVRDDMLLLFHSQEDSNQPVWWFDLGEINSLISERVRHVPAIKGLVKGTSNHSPQLSLATNLYNLY